MTAVVAFRTNVFALFLSILSLPALAASQPDPIDYSMWFLSDVRDTPECDLSYVDGRYDFGDAVTNPAISCPDSFAWKVFTQVVQQKFWEDWTSDRQAWPSDPWPRCEPGQTGENCCSELAISNEVWPQHCPVFPGATEGLPRHVLGTPSKAHRVPMAAAAGGAADKLGKWSDVPGNMKAPVIGAVQNELVFRNKAMMDYIFDRQMYHVEGLKAIYGAHLEKLGAYAPYRAKPLNPVQPTSPTEASAFVEFPIQSIMVKVNMMSFENARKLGMDPEDPDNPYIVVNLVPKVDDDTATTPEVELEPQILLAFHVSTKDLPNWFWATFEHVANQGRCDWLGCNDSFGYISTTTLEIGGDGPQSPSGNYQPPHKLMNADGTSVSAFDLARTYVGVDRISPELDALFKATGIATADSVNTSGRPTPGDKAWRSYRLKGSQTNFVDPTGRPTLLGNSVTEAGFVNSASCISCHARAGIDDKGLVPLDIFVDTLSNAGIPKSFNGTPVDAWFYVNGYYGVNGQREAPAVRAVPADFVYGIRNACPMSEMEVGQKWCKNVKSK
ncbi:hypothetical protein [Roseibium aggregatum]|uniref:Cytochrome c domain-containing protein n=1 Tax=Roseibium aggregatum TaxID=187304 RepID=A0A939EI11_9HYPH|nr:hypothetical protein [Roseibium aggregatum]MBN9673576.1 hypothetical protein [Roseibium aggregatum]